MNVVSNDCVFIVFNEYREERLEYEVEVIVYLF